MKKKYLKLTKEQKDRSVIFSSELIPKGVYDIDIKVHEITLEEWKENELEAREKMERLKDDKFFNDFYQYNLIRNA